MAQRSAGPSKEDWVGAGLTALIEGGIESVRIERLAVSLGVSKGPFYWRFKNRDELLKAIIEFWKRDFTTLLIDQTREFATARERLVALAELSLVQRMGSVDVAQAECALRAWAARDPMPRAAAAEVDAARIDHLTKEFALAGAPQPLAGRLAKAVYVALLGLYMLRQYTPELADDQSFLTAVETALDAAEAACQRGAGGI
ncbi:TetR/AcrR family transcriptional regulator [Mesorhizobium sp.]|uniref:TetR/AcrR family transcriptional regulator n=1 Tax=Mesorhizobium sp. TaxID=1871066 RepID=UPI0011F9A91A|nr:TetR/AcrR family transcriptional regulator [Mesorhizobium sp.]TIM11109.1 MAG: TetR/AcrR family transcriptional regulator [Mesorhizobium sp.]